MLKFFSSQAVSTRINAVLFRGEMTKDQSLGCERYMLAYFLLRSKRMRIPLSYLAYSLATVYHETGYSMQLVEEYGKGVGHEYGVIMNNSIVHDTVNSARTMFISEMTHL